MAEIKLKVIGAAGDTLAVSRAGERISLVHTAPYADGDWIAAGTAIRASAIRDGQLVVRPAEGQP